jgi:outer membrane protein assembly factor BamE (lipoprotein component of BamABCDE complex)
MLKPGVDDKQTVQETLGKPQEKPFDDLWWYYKDDITVKIYFDKNGTVKAKKWINEKKGQIITEPKGWIEK